MQLKYLFGSIVSLPLLPWMFLASKKVRRKVPVLSEPQDTKGSIGVGTEFKLLVIGESTMAGVGVTSHKEGFAGRLAGYIADTYKLKVNFEVVAKSGYTAALVSNKLISKIKTEQADLIVIGLGANDAFTLNTPIQWSESIFNLIKKLNIKFPETPIVFNNMPPIKAFPALPPVLKITVGNLVNILGIELQNVVSYCDKVYYNDEQITLDNWSKRYNLSDNPSTYFSDGIHPSRITYDLWAKDMSSFIERKGII